MAARLSVPLRGPGGEPVDLARTLASHGVATLPPMIVDEKALSFEVTLAVARGRPRTVRVGPGPRYSCTIQVAGRAPGAATADELRARVRHILGLDQDLSPFYEAVKDDPDLSWAAAGAGRMIRSP
ncbi:MAG: hypothetical protein M3271_11475, partial [Actinomycetota bacterium]|nr:hypothetical protein [Actinomycetota bacterium]